MILSGMRVVDWSTDIAASFCARLLADLGAEVIKIELPPQPGRPSRDDPSADPVAAALFGYLNHGKRSVTLDPGTARGAALFHDLIGSSAVLVESDLHRLPAGRAAAVADLRARWPGLVVVSVTPYGVFPRDSGIPASPLTLQHESSYAGHQARPVSDPSRQPPVGCTDREGPLATGVAAAVGALWGVLAAAGGEGVHVDMAMLDFYAAHISPDPLAEWCAGERDFHRGRDAFAGTEVAGGLIWMLRCADGWLLVSPREQHQWQRWMQLIGSPPWSEDPALCGTREIRRQHYARLQELMSEAISAMTREEIFDAARKAGVACFPMSEAVDLLDNKQLRHRNFFDALETDHGPTIAMPGLPFRLVAGDMELPRGRTARAPAIGEANAEILGALPGVTDADLGAPRLNTII